jgi:peroxiredoxin
MDLLTILLTQFPDANSIPSAFDNLLKEVDAMPGRVAEECATLARDKSPVPQVRATAQYVLAKTLRAAGDEASYLRAADEYERFTREHPDDPRAEDARRSAELLRQTLPGAPALDLVAKDADNLEVRLSGYRGRAVLLVFWDMSESCKARMPAVVALENELSGKSFVIVGANADRLTSTEFKAQSQALGIDWRSAMLYSRSSYTLEEWQVRLWPTCILIDARGKIAARDRPWDEMRALALSLANEAPPK